MNALRLLDDKTKCAIEAVLSKGERVELIPVKDGVKIIHIKREELKQNINPASKRCGGRPERG
mgnify:CR=1 FL=1